MFYHSIHMYIYNLHKVGNISKYYTIDMVFLKHNSGLKTHLPLETDDTETID